eukprot:CAMPEP_0113826790 /NCGR_PEP_ID=MMETSP0328-20130328/4438_1 /TAXON_ID=39455 /ORGANISM="Alexandrium minutum" /LENGTH=126 /DNA_ID=CAMNT_0000794769 /DNA_START=82 /DNA_END=460 /DNA_ORIENTATION=- /assembly_acc=CAM_ASM_000350
MAFVSQQGRPLRLGGALLRDSIVLAQSPSRAELEKSSVLLVEDEALLFVALGGLHLEEATEANQEEYEPETADQEPGHDVRSDHEIQPLRLLLEWDRALGFHQSEEQREGGEATESSSGYHGNWKG